MGSGGSKPVSSSKVVRLEDNIQELAAKLSKATAKIGDLEAEVAKLQYSITTLEKIQKQSLIKLTLYGTCLKQVKQIFNI